MPLGVAEIVELYGRKGAAQYGDEAVSQLEHALQCASLAEQAGAAPELVAASLLHDLGHLLADRPHVLDRDVDDVHQYLVLRVLHGAFPAAVLGPIGLHVDAKRYLCRAEPGYWDSLSAASKHSLELQGGVLDDAAARRFIGRSHAAEAVRLRRWDDAAKVPGRATPGLAHFAPLLRATAASR